MAGQYSGNFVRSYTTSQDLKPHYADPAHAGGTAADVRPGLEAKTVPASNEYMGTDFPSYDVVGGGFELWHPLDTHNSEGVTYPLYNDGQQIETIERVHSDPNAQHGYVRAEYIQPMLQGSTEVYSDTYRESLAPIPLNQKHAESGKDGWALPSSYGDTPPRLGMERQFTTRMIRRQARRQYRYAAQVLTQRDAGVNPSRTAQKRSLSSDIPAWVPSAAQSSHKNRVPGTWADPGIVDDSIMGADRPDTGYDVVF